MPDDLSLPAALLRVPVNHPMDALVVIDAAMTLLVNARHNIVAASGGRIEPAPKVLALAPPKKKTRQAKTERKPRRSAETPQATPQRAPAPPAERVAPVTINGVTIDATAGDESVSFNGKAMEVKARMAELAVHLARAMPSPVDRKFLAKKMWAGKAPEFAEQILGVLASELDRALSAIGLEVVLPRGVGIGMRPLEAQ